MRQSETLEQHNSEQPGCSREIDRLRLGLRLQRFLAAAGVLLLLTAGNAGATHAAAPRAGKQASIPKHSPPYARP
ncbi:hypothetical protein ACFTAO_15015 [Paenibacillus rhizoplanae]